ncbi:DUF551 domain-containing protein [Escherichia albertii]|nr:DUF551 domain-containing protein [Escherichia albertii]EIZ0267496.1 DUF551 domain-containing protein [Escherichia coli]
MTTITREQALKIIEVADEVISALAGTNEDVNPDSDNMLRLWDDLNDRHAPPEVVRELARIVLASLESEPVLYQSCTRPTWNSGVPWTEWKERSREGYEDDLRFTDTPDHAGWINKCRKLYTTPPAPVIQADVAQAIENLKQKLVECNRYNYCADAVKGVEDACRAVSYSQADNQPASGNQAAESNRSNEWTGNPDIDNAIIMLDRIDTLENCDDDRIEAVKAVLRRLAGNYPVIPDGWISCSERMPDDGQHVIILCDGAFVLYAQYRDGEFFDIVRNGDEFFETQSRNVTDWMPLPEPPQEVNRG